MNELEIIFSSTLRTAIPLVFAALGGLFSERSGVVNIALEGKMLIGALFAAICAHYTLNPWLGVGAGAAAGAVIGFVYAVFVILWNANQIVAGTAVNLFAVGVSPLICNLFFGITGGTPALPPQAVLLMAPYVMCIVTFFLVAYFYHFSVGGLWLQFAGEKPAALESCGIRVRTVRMASVTMAGLLAGIGGAMLSLFLSSSFSRNMTAGRGFMALAALILGRWKPLPTLVGSLVFALTESLQIQMQSAGWNQDQIIPTHIIQILPYLVTLVVVAGFFGRSNAPKALGK